MKPSERHRADAEALKEFRESYVDLVNSARRGEGRFFIVELHPAVPEVQWNQLRQRVAVATGTAVPAYLRNGGGTYTIRNAAYVMQGINPVANWEMSLRDPDQLRPETIVSVVESAIGRALQRAEDAAQRERGVVGVLAAFLRWPSELREAVGPDHLAQRRVAGAVGMFAQIIVVAVGGALTTGIVVGVVALWHVVS